MTISPFKWQTTALTVAGLGSCSALAGILQYTLFFGMSQALQKCRFFCVNHLEVIVEEKRKIILEVKEKLRDEENKFHELFIAKMWEITNSAPPGSMGELLKLIAIVQDKTPEAGDAIFQLLERYFRRRGVLYITSERLRLEDMWSLELSLNEYGGILKPHKYEDEAPLALLETINQCGDFLLGELRYRMRNFMRNEIVRGGAQGRNIDIAEVEREYRLKELPDKKTMTWIPNTKYYRPREPKKDTPKDSDMGSSEGESLWDTDKPNLSKWKTKEGYFITLSQYNNMERRLQRSTDASPAFRADPWHPWEVIDIPEEDKPLWEIITKSLPVLDDVNKAIIIGIMYDIPMSKTAKALGIPEGTVRSRKSRLLAETRKNATLLQILQQKRPVHPINI